MFDRDGISTPGFVSDYPTPDATEILANVVWIVEQLDEQALLELSDLPVLELARHISLRRRAAA